MNSGKRPKHRALYPKGIAQIRVPLPGHGLRKAKTIQPIHTTPGLPGFRPMRSPLRTTPGRRR